MTKIVCTVTTDLVYDQRMARICASLAGEGYEVTLVGRCKKESPGLKDTNYHQKRFNCLFEKGKLFYIEYNIRLFFFLLFASTDIICAVDLDTALPAWIVARLRKKKFVYDAHEYFTEVIELVNRPVVKGVWERIERLVLRNCRFAYTVSESIKREYEKKYPVKFEVIRNVPLLEPYQTPPKTDPYIVYVGAVNEGRGLEELIEAMSEIECKLYICGKGDVYPQLVKKTEELGLTTKVKFLGYVDPVELREITKRAYAGYLLLRKESLSYYYSLANKFFDYIHAGIPQVVINFPEYATINEKFEVALLCELERTNIRKNIFRLFNDDLLYQRLKENTMRAREEYNWQKESVKLIEFYKKVEKA